MSLVGALALVPLWGCAPAGEPNPAPVAGAGSVDSVAVARDSVVVAAEVTALLQASAAAWNRGDLAGFLDSYSDDPTLAFVGASGVRQGKAEIEASYRRSYFSGEGEADDLAFDQIQVRPLGSDFALAHGRWTLYEPGFDQQPIQGQGRFTLILRHEVAGWRILHDHSS